MDQLGIFKAMIRVHWRAQSVLESSNLYLIDKITFHLLNNLLDKGYNHPSKRRLDNSKSFSKIHINSLKKNIATDQQAVMYLWLLEEMNSILLSLNLLVLVVN